MGQISEILSERWIGRSDVKVFYKIFFLIRQTVQKNHQWLIFRVFPLQKSSNFNFIVSYMSDKSKARQKKISHGHNSEVCLFAKWTLVTTRYPFFHRLLLASFLFARFTWSKLYFLANSNLIIDMLSWLLLFKARGPVRVNVQWFSEIQKFVERKYKLMRQFLCRCVPCFYSLGFIFFIA